MINCHCNCNPPPLPRYLQFPTLGPYVCVSLKLLLHCNKVDYLQTPPPPPPPKGREIFF